MNISDKQLTALMDWVLSAILYSRNMWDPNASIEAQAKRDEMYVAFGFVCGSNNRPVVPQTQGLTTDELRPWPQHSEKASLIAMLLTTQKVCNGSYIAKAEDIMRLWPELKAIMEPERERCDICGRPQGHEPMPAEVCPGCGNRMRLEGHCTLCGRRLPDEMCGPCRRDESV